MTIKTPQGSWENWAPWNEVYKSDSPESFPKWEYFVWPVNIFSASRYFGRTAHGESSSARALFTARRQRDGRWLRSLTSPLEQDGWPRGWNTHLLGFPRSCQLHQAFPGRANLPQTLAADPASLDTPAGCHCKEPLLANFTVNIPICHFLPRNKTAKYFENHGLPLVNTQGVSNGIVYMFSWKWQGSQAVKQTARETSTGT